MAEKTLNAWVVLGGKVDNSFQQIGQNLVNLGGSIDGISQKLINFGKESINTYRNYEDSMLDAEVAMSTTYGRGTKALQDVMNQLDRQASEWAASTIFHTDDVANAISEAAHANWDLEKIMEGLPAAMRLAQAGSLDLSTGLDYIIKSTNAAGIQFDDLSEWIDEWTYAANSSAGTVEQFGEAMLKMGSTMQFADNKEELLTMLAVLHDSGTVGSSAGTLLRNSMIRLIAPTKKAADAMAELGITEADISEAMAEVDGDTEAVVAQLEEAGFSAYNSKGELKDFTEIFEDLYLTTKDMDEQSKYNIWSALFPTRTITGAKSLIEAAGKSWNGLLDDLESGKATGYGAYAAETMMSGVTGSVETAMSKVEELKRQLGNQLTPQLKNILGNEEKVLNMLLTGGQENGVSSGLSWLSRASDLIGDLAENMGGLDPALFDAIVDALGSIAVLGPGLMIGGLAIRGVGTAMSVFTGSPVGKVILAATAIGMLASAANAFAEAKYLDNFGNMQIDTSSLDQKMTEIHDAFLKGAGPAQEFAKALDDCVTNYENASEKLSATMIEDLLTGQTLTGEERAKKLAEYRTLGSDMVKEVKAGIQAGADMSAEFWMNILLDKDGQPKEGYSPLFTAIAKTLNEEKDEALEEATAIGNEIEAAITAAWEDGELTEEERTAIKEKIRKMNDFVAEMEREAQNEEDLVQRKLMLDKAQGMDYTQMNQYVTDTIMSQRQAELDYLENGVKAEAFRFELRRDKYLAEGNTAKAEEYDRLINGYTDEKGNHVAGLWESYNESKAGIYSDYDQMIMRMFAATINDSALSEDASNLRQAATWLTSGWVTDVGKLRDYAGENDVNLPAIQRYYEEELKALGGVEEVKSRIATYSESGNEELQAMADDLRNILAVYAILKENIQEYADVSQGTLGTGEFEALYRQGFFGKPMANYLQSLMDADIDEGILQSTRGGMDSTTGGYLDAMAQAFANAFDIDLLLAQTTEDDDRLFTERSLQDFALAKLLGMSEAERQQYALGGEASNYYQAIQDYETTKAAYDALYSQLSLPEGGIGGTAAELEQLKNLKLDLDLKEQAVAEAKTAWDAVQAQFDTPITGKVALQIQAPEGMDTLDVTPQAYGGRAEGPSLIAERGVPEWYIPEEHTPNTARLLAAAAANSGFSLTELAEESGARLFADGGTDGTGDTGASLDWGSLPGGTEGGSSDGETGGGTINIQYAPVIHADNADGVERKLREDKERFKKWFNDFMAERALYESMVAYQ